MTVQADAGEPSPRISVVVPALNEALDLPHVFARMPIGKKLNPPVNPYVRCHVPSVAINPRLHDKHYLSAVVGSLLPLAPLGGMTRVDGSCCGRTGGPRHICQQPATCADVCLGTRQHSRRIRSAVSSRGSHAPPRPRPAVLGTR